MCGKEVGGLNNAEADLFTGAPFAFTTLPRTTDQAREFAEHLAYSLGAHPVWIGPKTHDEWVAATSHLPYIIASALVLATPLEASQLISSGFRSTSRLASTPVSIMMPILETNRENLLEALSRFHDQLNKVESALSDTDSQSLQALLNQGAIQRNNLID